LRALSRRLERLLVPVDRPLRHAELLAALDAGLLEVQGGDDGDVAREEQVERLRVDEGRVLEASKPARSAFLIPWVARQWPVTLSL
jgi:hypothetical protein